MTTHCIFKKEEQLREDLDKTLFLNNSHWGLKQFSSQVAGSQNDVSTWRVMLDTERWDLCNVSSSNVRMVVKGNP